MKHSTLRTVLLSLYSLLIVSMGAATFIGQQRGSDAAVALVYGSWWFIAMWAALAGLSLVLLVRRGVHRHLAVMLLHVAFIVILLGALTTHLTAEHGTIHLRQGIATDCFSNADSSLNVLPFSLTLEHFEVVSYPSSDAVMDYRCRICVRRGERTIPMQVSMNSIGRFAGYRFYQSAYDSDLQGTQLLVAHDPWGIGITYAGYAMLLLGLISTLLSRHTRIRQLYRIATRSAVLLLLLVIVVPIQARQHPSMIRSEIADEMGRIAVLYNGRICPLNTAATDFLTKLSGRSSWQGYSANQVFLGWMIYYTEWEQQPIIRIKNRAVQQMLGIRGEWASVRDFYHPNGTYKLQGKRSLYLPQEGDISQLPDAARKAIREADEKMQVVSMFYGNEMLRIFPLEEKHHRLAWHTPGSTELPLGTPEAEFQFINHAMDYLVRDILVNDVSASHAMIRKIRFYQREKAASVIPSDFTLWLEVQYNTLQAGRWVVFLCLTLSLLFALLFVGGAMPVWLQRVHTAIVVAQTGYLSALLAMRWWISGHVPVSNGHETMLLMAWISVVVTLVTMRRFVLLKAFGPVVASFCLLVAMLASGNPQVTQLMPVLQSPLLSIHVVLVMISYALFALVTLIALQALWLHICHRDAELIRTTALSQLLLYPAVALLATGIFVGAVWANISWGTYWSWDPKETWALITLMIYAIPLHRTFLDADRPLLYHAYILLAFLAVLMTYFGVNFFMSGMHSYA